MAGELILYATEDGDLVVRLQERNGSVWLTQLQLAELFQTTVSNINKHIRGILDDYEQEEATVEEYSIVQTEGKRSVERFETFDANRRAAEALAADEADIAQLEEMEKAAKGRKKESGDA